MSSSLTVIDLKSEMLSSANHRPLAALDSRTSMHPATITIATTEPMATAETKNHVWTIVYTRFPDRLFAAHLFAHSSKAAQTMRPSWTTTTHNADTTLAPWISLAAMLADNELCKNPVISITSKKHHRFDPEHTFWIESFELLVSAITE